MAGGQLTDMEKKLKKAKPTGAGLGGSVPVSYGKQDQCFNEDWLLPRSRRAETSREVDFQEARCGPACGLCFLCQG